MYRGINSDRQTVLASGFDLVFKKLLRGVCRVGSDVEDIALIVDCESGADGVDTAAEVPGNDRGCTAACSPGNYFAS